MVPSDTSPGDVIGQDFGPYKILRRLGMGGMAETFEAIRQGPSGFTRRVCLKLVRPALREDESSIHLFEREARLAAKLHHSNIVSVIDFGEIEGTLYMALELVDGVDLQRRGKRIPRRREAETRRRIAGMMPKTRRPLPRSRMSKGSPTPT